MEKVGVTIIGAGVIGLSIGAEISKHKNSVYILERHDSFGCETSSRNSEVIHAGIYYPPNSLKAQNCVEGNRLTYEVCSKNNMPYKKLGKLIIAIDDSEISILEELFKNAKANGVKEIELISANKIKQLAPNIKAKAALSSKTTGIIDSHALMKFYAHSAQNNKATITYNANVKALKKVNGFYEVTVLDASGEEFKFLSEVLINCAGLESDTIAAMVGIDIEKQQYKLNYCKGQYFSIKAKASKMIDQLIYPTPVTKSGGLGIHATPNLAHMVRLGPDDTYIKRENYNYNVNEKDKIKFYKSAHRFLPFLKIEDLTADTSGIRPKLQAQGGDFRDFVIKEESLLGMEGLINLIGIESPGLTGAGAIARRVSKLLK